MFMLFVFVSYADTISFKSGKVIEAKIVERTDESIKVDLDGTKITYWLDEIVKINDEIIKEQKSEPQQTQDNALPINQEKSLSQKEDEPQMAAGNDELYKEAAKKLIKDPADLKKVVDQALQNEWTNDEAILRILKNNEQAIEIFKKAAQQNSDGFIFGARPKVYNPSELPQYMDYILIFKLVLLKAKENIAKDDYKNAEENLISTLGFIEHLAKQKYQILLANIIQRMAVGLIEPMIKLSIQNNVFPQDFYRLILKKMNSIAKNMVSGNDLLDDRLNMAEGDLKFLQDEMIKHTAEGSKERMDVENYWTEFFKYYETEYNDVLIVEKEDFKNNQFSATEKKLAELKDKFQKDLPLDLKLMYKVAGDKGMPALGEMVMSKNDPMLAAKYFILLSSILRYGPVISTYYILSTKNALLTLAVAIKLYELDKTKTLENLENLVPDYLEKIPQDPFNNFSPIKYLKENNHWLIYSFGPDKKDDSGKANLDLEKYVRDPSQNEGDITFSN